MAPFRPQAACRRRKAKVRSSLASILRLGGFRGLVLSCFICRSLCSSSLAWSQKLSRPAACSWAADPQSRPCFPALGGPRSVNRRGRHVLFSFFSRCFPILFGEKNSASTRFTPDYPPILPCVPQDVDFFVLTATIYGM